MENILNAKALKNRTENLLTPSQQIQRKAFFIGLTSILSESQAHEVLDEWSAFINETGSAFNGLNSFARDVCKNYDKDNKQRDLVKALNRALFTKDKIELNNEIVVKTASNQPAIEMTAQTDLPNSTEQPISTSDFQTFEYLFTRILALVKVHSPEISNALDAFLYELIESMPWSEAQQKQILTLINSGNSIQVRAYRPDQLKTFLNHLRSWLAGEITKTKAESIIKRAISETELQPMATRYSPLNLV